MPGDRCDPKPPPFVCACISEHVALVAQDTLGSDTRFIFYMGGALLCIFSAVFCVCRVFTGCGDYLSRRFARGQLRRHVRQADDDEKSKLSATLDRVKEEDEKASRQVQGELVGLCQCAWFTTWIIAFLGGPAMLVVAWFTQQSYGYWVGCSFLIPEVIVVRQEFMG